jgi:hypothetical protein
MDFKHIFNKEFGQSMSLDKESAKIEFTEACYTLYGELKVSNDGLMDLDRLATELSLNNQEKESIEQEVVSDITTNLMMELTENGFLTSKEKNFITKFVKSTGLSVQLDKEVYRQFDKAYTRFLDYGHLLDENSIKEMYDVTLMSNARTPSELDEGVFMITNDAAIFAGKRKTINVKSSLIAKINKTDTDITLIKTTSSNHIKMKIH